MPLEAPARRNVGAVGRNRTWHPSSSVSSPHRPPRTTSCHKFWMQKNALLLQFFGISLRSVLFGHGTCLTSGDASDGLGADTCRKALLLCQVVGGARRKRHVVEKEICHVPFQH